MKRPNNLVFSILVAMLVAGMMTTTTNVFHYVLSSVRVTLTPDVSNKPGYQKHLERLKASDYHTQYDLGILGDSLAHALQFKILKECCSLSLLNLGIPGDTSKTLLQRLSYSESFKVEHLYILIGTNDIGRNVPSHETLKNVASIIEQTIQLADLTLLLIPFSDGFKRNNQKILEMNQAYLVLCKDYAIECLDINDALSEENKLKKAFSADGLHLNSLGINTLAKFISEDFKKHR